MTTTINSFESPPSGTTLANGNGANGDGSANWTGVSIGPGGTLVTDTANVAHGSQSLKVATGSTAAATYAIGALAASATSLWSRLYIYLTANPSGALKFLVPLTAVNGNNGQFIISTSGKLVVLDLSGTTLSTSTNAVSLNQWIRVESKILVAGTSTGTAEVKLFNSAESTTPTETNTNTNVNMGTDPITQFRLGSCAANANIGPVWFDSLALSDGGSYLGPDLGSSSGVLPFTGFFAA